MPSHLVDTASDQLPIFVFSSFFSSSVVGFYAMTQRVLRLPLTVLGTAVGQVYFQKANEYKSDPVILRDLTWGLYKKISVGWCSASWCLIVFLGGKFSALYLDKVG